MAYLGNTPTQQGFTPAIDYFSGNASTTAFTLSRPVASVAQVQAVIENVPQNPGDAFTVSGNTITFTSAPPSGTNNIYVYYTSPITTVVQPGQGTVYPTSLSTGGPYWSTSGNVGIGTTSPANILDVNGALRSIASSGASSGAGVEVDYGGAGTGIGRVLAYDRTGGTFKQLNLQGQPIVFVNGSTEAMRIDSSGRVTMPYQPAFRAYSNAGSYSTTGVDIAFPNTNFNIGSYYNTSNGRFTAPVAGIYLFLWSTSSSGATSFSLDLHKNGSPISYSEQNNSLNYFVTGQSQLVSLAVGDYVTWRLRFGTLNLSDPSTNVQGFLVG